MRNKKGTIMWVLTVVFVLAFSLFAINLFWTERTVSTYADDSAIVADTDEFVKAAVQPDNAVVLTPDGGGVTVTGSQENDRTVVVFDRAYELGSKINFTVKLTPDVTGTGSDGSLKENVFSAIYFAQATKTEDGFSVSDFNIKRSSGNGMYLHLFTNVGDLKPNNRAMINVSTFTVKDIVNADSVWGGLGDGGNDLGWAYVNNKPIGVEIGTENVGGVAKVYFQFSIDRTPARPRITVYKISVNQSDLIDTADGGGYYIAVETANMNATTRSVNVEISEITVVEAGLVIEPENVFLKPTQTKTLTVKDAITETTVNTGLTFSSDKTAVATVDGNGVVTAVSAGTAKITVTHTDGRTGEAYITVANNITLNPNALNLFVGQTATLTATTNPANLTVLWTIDNDSIATVNNGLITALSEGTAVVKATVQNFESGDLEISATATITVVEYVQPQDIHGDDFDAVFSDGVIVGVDEYSYAEGKYLYNGTVQSGFTYLAITDGLSFDNNPVTFDFINTYDVSNTNDANHMNRFFGISIVQGSAKTLVAADYALGAANGVQINFSSNGGWWAWGGKFFMNYRTSVQGNITSHRTPENTGALTGTDRFANAFCRAFSDGWRIQVKIWKDGTELKVAFTPVFNEGEIPDGTEDLLFPNGGQYDFIGPYTMSFAYDDVANGEGDFVIAVGTGNMIPGTASNMVYSIENLDRGELFGLTLNRESVVMKKDATFTLEAQYNPSTYNPLGGAWTTSDSSVATVSESGEITAVGGGKADITYTVGGLSATCEVSVIESLTVNAKTFSLKVGETYKIIATTSPAGVDVVYISGNPNFATVDNEGNITAVAEGSVVIYVKAGGELFVEEITVTVSPAVKESDGCNCSSAVSGSAAILSALSILVAVVFITVKRKIRN